jgi:uncharacterized protein YukE
MPRVPPAPVAGFLARSATGSGARSHMMTVRTAAAGGVVPSAGDQRSVMGKAIVDPEELRRFAQDLKRFNNELKNQMQILNGRFISLGQTWRDQEHRKFAQQFEETIRSLIRFQEVSVEQIPFLLRKAEQIEEYLR